MSIILIVAVILIVGSLWFFFSSRNETGSAANRQTEGQESDTLRQRPENMVQAQNRSMPPDLAQALKSRFTVIVITLLLLSYLFSAAADVFHELAEKERATANPNLYYLEEKTKIENPLLFKLAKGTMTLEKTAGSKDFNQVVEMVRSMQNDVAEARKAIEKLAAPPDCQELKELTSIYLLITQTSFDAMLNNNKEEEKNLKQQLNIFKEKLAKEERRIRELSEKGE